MMKAEIKDEDKQIFAALRAIGSNVSTKEVEIVLNIVDLIRESKSDITLKEVMQMKRMVDSLYEE